jgi:hypothetical protein
MSSQDNFCKSAKVPSDGNSMYPIEYNPTLTFNMPGSEWTWEVYRNE